MSVVGIGVDMVDVTRFAASMERTPGFLNRVLTLAEIEGRSVESLAARFAAKEAVAKALGSPGTLAWHDCQIVSSTSGRPWIEVSGSVAEAAAAMGIREWQLSLSHDGGMAIAFVIASR